MSVSLYEQITIAEPSLTAIQVSPATLKALISSTIDLLIDHNISATLWVKFPRGTAWQEDLDRYTNLMLGSVYVLTPAQLDSTDHPELATLEQLPPPSPSLFTEPLGSSLTDGSQLISLKINPDTFRREYFLLAVAKHWCSLLLAHRPRSSQPAQSSPPLVGSDVLEQELPFGQQPSMLDLRGQPPALDFTDWHLLEEQPSERKHPLLLLNSLTNSTIYHALTSIQTAVCGDLDSASELYPHTPAIDWTAHLTACQTSVPRENCITSLLTRQLQHQEDLWRQVVTYRRQGSTLEALRSQNQALLRELRLKDEFLNNVGQELRTPLTNMKTALTLLNSPNLKPNQRQRYMQLVSTECDRQSSLITSMLDLVQLDYTADHDPLQSIPLAEVVPGVVSTYQPLAQEKGLMLAYTIPEDLPLVLCLPTWLRQIAINLLHNAIKFTLPGGRVWVRAKQQGDYVQLEFQDTGVGIPAPEIPKIFDRFYRVRHTTLEDVSGVGLGLTIVQQILLRCGGSISVKSRVNEGSTFNVLLPIAHPNQPQP